MQTDNRLYDPIQSKFLQTDRWLCNGRPLSVILADIHMVRTKNEVVKPMNPPFYKRFVDDIYSRRNKSQQDVLFEDLNNFHPNIKLAIDVNPERFLDKNHFEQ